MTNWHTMPHQARSSEDDDLHDAARTVSGVLPVQAWKAR